MRDFKKRSDLLIPFIVISFLFVIPVILANIYYYDDYGRALLGYTQWNKVDGRPLAEVAMVTLMQSTKMYDISPLPLLAGLVVLSISAKYFIEIIDSKASWYAVPVFLSILSNPFILEPLSYRFDSLIFLLSLAVALAYVYEPRKIKHSLVWGFACSISVLFLYQTSFNVILCMLAVRFLVKCNSGFDAHQIMKRISLSVIELALAVITFTLANKYIFKLEANSYHPGVATGNIFKKVIDNISEYIQFVNDLHPLGKPAILLILLISIVSSLKVASKAKASGKLSKILIYICSFTIPFLCLIASAGILLILDKPLLTPRSVIGFSGFMVFSSTALYLSLKRKIFTFIFLVPFMSSLLTCFAYGNAYKEQYKVFDSIAQNIITDTQDYRDGSLNFSFEGIAPSSEIYKNSVKELPILSKLIPGEFYNGWWAVMYMRKAGWVQNPSWYSSIKFPDAHELACRTLPIAKRKYYYIFKEDNFLLIDFNKSTCSR